MTKGKLSHKFKHWLYLCFGLVLFFVVLFFCLDFLFPLRVSVKYSQVIADKNGKIVHIFLASDDKWRIKTRLDEISPELKKAILFKEDRYFYWHFGVNPLSVIRALLQNTIQGKTASGASTITMQVARLLEPQQRTIWAKITEAFRAVQMEWYYSKDEILQLYLNLVPYGGNIEGVKSASLLFMGIEPKQLSLAQAVTLAIVPNRPTSLALGKNNALIQKERNQWLKRMLLYGIFHPQDVENALLEPLEAMRRPPIRNWPHLCHLLHKKYPERDWIQVSLDPNLQSQVEKLALAHIQIHKPYNIHNAAVLVVDNQTRNVLAYVGSADFDDIQHAGQVNGVLAYRSPGSTLKPLIYGLAFDLGYATPATVVYDVPSNFGGYAPENFDLKYRGKITVREALATSLNITAVGMLDKIGRKPVIEKLILADFKKIEQDKDVLGLSLALGGCAVNLWELTGLYAAIADGGIYRPLKWFERDTASHLQNQIMSREASYMLAEILTTAERPDIPNGAQNALSIPKISWKTGTSYGRRDAWCIGFNRFFTVGVWVGNFDNTGVQELTGAQVAAPLVFKIFQRLKKGWLDLPHTLQSRMVCKETGLLPAHFCTHLIEDFFIPGVSENRICAHLKEYFVDEKCSKSYCRECLPPAGYRREYFENIDQSLKSYYQSAMIPIKLPPPHNPDCQHIGKSTPPRITSPLADRKYTLINRQSQLTLTCQTPVEVHRVYWYINDKFLCQTPAQTPVFFSPPKGKIKISCTDDRGQNTDLNIEVE